MDVFGCLVSSIVVCRMVLTRLDMETEETVCGLGEVLCVSAVGDTEEVENDASDVTKEV